MSNVASTKALVDMVKQDPAIQNLYKVAESMPELRADLRGAAGDIQAGAYTPEVAQLAEAAVGKGIGAGGRKGEAFELASEGTQAAAREAAGLEKAPEVKLGPGERLKEGEGPTVHPGKPRKARTKTEVDQEPEPRYARDEPGKLDAGRKLDAKTRAIREKIRAIDASIRRRDMKMRMLAEENTGPPELFVDREVRLLKEKIADEKAAAVIKARDKADKDAGYVRDPSVEEVQQRFAQEEPYKRTSKWKGAEASADNRKAILQKVIDKGGATDAALSAAGISRAEFNRLQATIRNNVYQNYIKKGREVPAALADLYKLSKDPALSRGRPSVRPGRKPRGPRDPQQRIDSTQRAEIVRSKGKQSEYIRGEQQDIADIKRMGRESTREGDLDGIALTIKTAEKKIAGLKRFQGKFSDNRAISLDNILRGYENLINDMRKREGSIKSQRAKAIGLEKKSQKQQGVRERRWSKQVAKLRETVSNLRDQLRGKAKAEPKKAAKIKKALKEDDYVGFATEEPVGRKPIWEAMGMTEARYKELTALREKRAAAARKGAAKRQKKQPSPAKAAFKARISEARRRTSEAFGSRIKARIEGRGMSDAERALLKKFKGEEVQSRAAALKRGDTKKELTAIGPKKPLWGYNRKDYSESLRALLTREGGLFTGKAAERFDALLRGREKPTEAQLKALAKRAKRQKSRAKKTKTTRPTGSLLSRVKQRVEAALAARTGVLPQVPGRVGPPKTPKPINRAKLTKSLEKLKAKRETRQDIATIVDAQAHVKALRALAKKNAGTQLGNRLKRQAARIQAQIDSAPEAGAAIHAAMAQKPGPSVVELTEGPVSKKGKRRPISKKDKTEVARGSRMKLKPTSKFKEVTAENIGEFSDTVYDPVTRKMRRKTIEEYKKEQSAEYKERMTEEFLEADPMEGELYFEYDRPAGTADVSKTALAPRSPHKQAQKTGRPGGKKAEVGPLDESLVEAIRSKADIRRQAKALGIKMTERQVADAALAAEQLGSHAVLIGEGGSTRSISLKDMVENSSKVWNRDMRPRLGGQQGAAQTSRYGKVLTRVNKLLETPIGKTKTARRRQLKHLQSMLKELDAIAKGEGVGRKITPRGEKPAFLRQRREPPPGYPQEVGQTLAKHSLEGYGITKEGRVHPAVKSRLSLKEVAEASKTKQHFSENLDSFIDGLHRRGVLMKGDATARYRRSAERYFRHIESKRETPRQTAERVLGKDKGGERFASEEPVDPSGSIAHTARTKKGDVWEKAGKEYWRHGLGKRNRDFLDDLHLMANKAGIFKTALSSGDLSNPFRQTLILTASQALTSPRRTISNFKEMAASYSKKYYDRVDAALKSDQWYQDAKKSGVNMIESPKEHEAFGGVDIVANWIHAGQKKPKLDPRRWLAAAGEKVFLGAARSFTHYQNIAMRDAFKDGVQFMKEHGEPITPRSVADLSDLINVFGHRTPIKNKLIRETGNIVFFSPQMIKSNARFFYHTMMDHGLTKGDALRIVKKGGGPDLIKQFRTEKQLQEFLESQDWAKNKFKRLPGEGKYSGATFGFQKFQTKAVRQIARRSVGKTLLFGWGLLGLGISGAVAAGKDWSIETDPHSSDFWKLRVEDTTWDPWGGKQQYFRQIAQMAAGKEKLRSSGREKKVKRVDIAARAARSKLNPAAGLAASIITGVNAEGREVFRTPGGTARGIANAVVMLSMQDLWEVAQNNFNAYGALLMMGSVSGIGIQAGPGYKGSWMTKELRPVEQRVADEIRRRKLEPPRASTRVTLPGRNEAGQRNYYVLDKAEREAFEAEVMPEVYTNLDNFINSPAYQNLSDRDKIRVLQKQIRKQNQRYSASRRLRNELKDKEPRNQYWDEED
jgi:hypothetical protein